ncbi:MAG TPA: hypothetical protein VJ867_05505 [Gemmatimonadaceae bacterium]|nr:hypothetical protein [Gemmatimonadaceae bacterium]
MSDHIKEPPEPGIIDTPSPPPRRRRWLKWSLIAFAALIAVPALIIALWGWITLSYTYSSGDRTGYVQKFSHKGWVCKTWEGELAMVTVPGQPQEKWDFSVRDDSIAALIRQSMGNKVALIYDEHHGVPSSCFGDTQYFVTGVRPVHEP